MNCGACGALAADGDMFCGGCGAKLAERKPSPAARVSLDPEAVERLKGGAHAAAKIAQDLGVQVGKSSMLRGLIVMFASFFLMPFKTMSSAGRLLRSIGERGALDEKTDQPHLTWLMTAFPVWGTLVFFSIMIGGALNAFGVVKLVPQAGSSPVAIVSLLVVFYLVAVVVDWLIMIVGELLSLRIRLSQYSRSQLDTLRGHSASLQTIADLARGSN